MIVDNSALPTYDRNDGELPASVDLVVIGAGVAGAATAYFAARAGLKVLVIERRSSIASLTTAAATGASQKGSRGTQTDPAAGPGA